MSSFTWCPSVSTISFVTFEDGHVDVGANLWHLDERPWWRLCSTALCWLQVITAVLARHRRDIWGRHQGHQGEDGQNEEDPQHSCASFTSVAPLQSTEETEERAAPESAALRVWPSCDGSLLVTRRLCQRACPFTDDPDVKISCCQCSSFL